MAHYIEFNLPSKEPEFEGAKTLDGRPYRFRFWWNNTTQCWSMEMTSIQDPTIALLGLVLLPGKEILGRHGYTNILGELWLEDTVNTGENPTYENFGDTFKLRYYPLEG